MSKARMLGMAARRPLKKEKPRGGWQPNTRGKIGKKHGGFFGNSIAPMKQPVKEGENNDETEEP